MYKGVLTMEEKDRNLNLADRLGELSRDLAASMVAKDVETARRIRAEMADLLDDGKANDSVGDLDFNDEFVRQWYNDCD